jgi:hypothetical protein
LNKRGTVKTRQEFIEADYVNGVQNEKGEQVIRPLNEAEREWLSQFYAETEHGNFKKTREIEEQKHLYKQLQRDYRTNYKQMTFEEASSFREKIDETYRKLVHLRAETNTFYPEDVDRQEVWDRGNRRKEDIFNRAKVSNNLISLDIHEFDDFTTRAEKDINPEHLVLDYLTRKPAKKVIRRKKK